MAALKKVYIVQGIHPHVPGRPMTAHTTRSSANVEASQMASRILVSMGRLPCDPKSWKIRIENYKNELSEVSADAECDVWISELPLKE